MALFVLRNLIFQTGTRSHPVGLDVWFLVGLFIYFQTSCVRTVKALARLRGRPLAWTFAGRLCDKYHNVMSWLICVNFSLPAFLCATLILTPTKAASNNQAPNRCRILLHLGLLEARGIRLSRDSRPGRHCGVGAADFGAEVALLPVEIYKWIIF